MAFFSYNRTSARLLRDEITIMNIQQVAYRLAATGLFLGAEQNHTRSQWEERIKVSAKNRAIFALYYFDYTSTTVDDLPTFCCDELEVLPAPAGKTLWQAQRIEQWECVYNKWLGCRRV